MFWAACFGFLLDAPPLSACYNAEPSPGLLSFCPVNQRPRISWPRQHQFVTAPKTHNVYPVESKTLSDGESNGNNFGFLMDTKRE
eukprot:4760930-Amphidinium_carterae.1